MKEIVFVKCAKSQNVGDTVQCREQRKHFDNKKQSIYNKAHDHWAIREPLNSKEFSIQRSFHLPSDIL